VHTESEVLEITASSVVIKQSGENQDIPADTVILAVGTRSWNPLQKVAEEQDIPCQVIGDALHPAMVYDAIHQGFAAGRNIL